MDELISIVIPVYNCEQYLEDCVVSILNQSYANFELLLIDGGGTDSSGELCDILAKTDTRIRVHHKANEGVSVARNVGLAMARGEWIGFIDADDLIAEDYLEKLHELTQGGDKPDLVLCNMSDVYADGIPKKRRLENALTGAFQQDYWLLHSLLIGPVVKLYRRDILDKYNILFPKGISCGEDELFNYQYYRLVKQYRFLDEGLYFYYHRPNASLSQKQSRKIYEGMLYKLRQEAALYRELGIAKAGFALNESALTIALNYYALGEADEFAGYCQRLEGLLTYLDCNVAMTKTIHIKALRLIKEKKYRELYVYAQNLKPY